MACLIVLCFLLLLITIIGVTVQCIKKIVRLYRCTDDYRLILWNSAIYLIALLGIGYYVFSWQNKAVKAFENCKTIFLASTTKSFSASLKAAHHTLITNPEHGAAMLVNVWKEEGRQMNMANQKYYNLLKMRTNTVSLSQMSFRLSQVDSLIDFFDYNPDKDILAEAYLCKAKLVAQCGDTLCAANFCQKSISAISANNQALKNEASILLNKLDKMQILQIDRHVAVYKDTPLSDLKANKIVIIAIFLLLVLYCLIYYNLKSQYIKQRQKLLELRLYKYNSIQERDVEKQKERNSKVVQVKESDIYKTIVQKINDNDFSISKEQWNELNILLNSVYDDFERNLKSFSDITEQELRICMLVKIGVTPANIAKFTHRTKEAITAARRRLYKKMFLKDGSPSDCDQFILSL